MGTNYYWRTTPAKICEACGHTEPAKELHIGKSSAGWTFSFHAIPDKDLTSWRQWSEFLVEGALWKRGAIFNEYDEEISVITFRNLVESKMNENHSHAKEYPHIDGSYLDREGHSFSPGEFS